MNNWAEYVGYVASAFVVGSFLLKEIKTIRLVNLIGCICFVIYGVYKRDALAYYYSKRDIGFGSNLSFGKNY